MGAVARETDYAPSTSRYPNNPDVAAAQAGYLDVVAALIGQEDYAAGKGIRRGMRSGANTT